MRVRNTTFRTVVYDNGVEAELDFFIGRNKVEEQIRAAEWLLSRKPENGMPQAPSNSKKVLVHVVGGQPLAGTGDIWVLYSYDEENVYIHGLKIHDPK